MMRPIQFIAIGFLLFFASPSTSSQAGSANTAPTGINATLQNCQHQVASWQREAGIEITLAVVIVVLGGLVSLLQKANYNWAKGATVGLGVAISILTAINSRVFIADDRTLRRAAFDGSSVINELLIMADELRDDHLSDENRSTLKAEYLKKLSEFHAIGEKLTGTEPAAVAPQNAANSFGITRVYAQSAKITPEWVQNPPSNDASFFFVGKGYDASLSNAKRASLDDALSSAVQALRSKAPNASDHSLLSIIKPSALVQDSSFDYERKTGKYTYYTLLRISRDIENISLKSLPPAINAQSVPTRFQSRNWRPGDLTASARSGLFVLSTDGEVFRLVTEQQGSSRLEKLFRLRRAYSGYALAANSEAVFVVATSNLGCTVFKYALMNKVVSERLVAPHERCVGIATDGSAVYLTFPDQKEIRYLISWDASSVQRWSFSDTDALGYIAFDDLGRRLIVADASGKAYSITVPDGQKQLMASNLGAVSSIATSRFHILVASGKKVLFLSRSDSRGENPPAGLQSLTGGHIVGVAVDGSDELWFADYDNKIVEGPFPLS